MTTARGRLSPRRNMDILAALKAEESKLAQQLETVQGAIKVFQSGPSTNGAGRKKMSPEGRARIAAAQKKRWAAVRKAKQRK
jgi:hypothetical protein